MAEGERRRKRATRRRASQDGFWPVKQVGIAYSIGFPLMVFGILIGFATATAEGDNTELWLLAGGLFLLGVIISASNKVV